MSLEDIEQRTLAVVSDEMISTVNRLVITKWFKEYKNLYYAQAEAPK